MTGDRLALPHSGPEERLVCALLSRMVAHASPAPIETDAVAWPRFLRLVDRHRVAPAVWRVLQAEPSVDVPEAVRSDIKRRYHRTAVSNLRGSATLVEVADMFEAAGIDMLPLKGISLAVALYGDIGARHSGDLDVLVAPERLADADRALRARGWRRISNRTHEEIALEVDGPPPLSHHLSYAKAGQLSLELHFELNPNPALLPVKMADLIAGGATFRLGTRTLKALPPAVHLLFLATHGARHNWKRLQWLLDMALMVDRASPAEVDAWLDEAAACGVTAPLVQGLLLARAAFGLELPPRVLAGAASRRVGYMTRRAAGHVFRSLEDEPDEVAAGLDAEIRLYRMCMSPRLAYHWHEVARGIQSLTARWTGRDVDS